MNRTSNSNLIKLIGRFAKQYGYEDLNLDLYDRSLVEQCIREWEFYHPPEPLSITGNPNVPAIAFVETGAVGEPARKAKRV